MPQQLELQLPYVEITGVANQKELRSLGLTRGKETYFVDFHKLKIREGFNVRREYEDENNKLLDLSSFIFQNGLPEVLRVDILKDGTTYIDEGHRRYMALQLLNASGLLEDLDKPGVRNGKIECFVNDNNVDELTRLTRQHSSNAGKKFTSLELSETAKRMEVFFRLTQEEIGQRLGMSRQNVKNLLIIAEQSDVVKQAIQSHMITPTAAVELVRKLKDGDKVTEKVQEAVSSGKAISVSDVKKIIGDVDEAPFGEVKKESPFNTQHSTSSPEQNNPNKDKEDKEVKFDEGRDEIALVQKVIRNHDKMNSIISKIDCVPEQTKTDINQLVEWNQNFLSEIRLWIHKNKKHNKIR